jgi:hypothetical protein
MRGSISIREFYVATRYDHGIRESVKRTAEYKGITREEVCESLGINEMYAILPEPKARAVDISAAIDNGTYAPPPVDDEYREKRGIELVQLRGPDHESR